MVNSMDHDNLEHVLSLVNRYRGQQRDTMISRQHMLRTRLLVLILYLSVLQLTLHELPSPSQSLEYSRHWQAACVTE
jgi:hypothetical protein